MSNDRIKQLNGTQNHLNTMVEHPDRYFRKWIPGRSKLLIALEKEAEEQQIPIVGPVVGNLLYLLVMVKNPDRIVELGTATGYSAVFMGNACRSIKGKLTTFEADPGLARQASQHIEKAGLKDWVQVRCEDALIGLRRVQSPIDMIFMDIEKYDYLQALPLCKEKLGKNGLLVVDNTGFQDADAFNRAIAEDDDWAFVNLWAFLPGHSPDYDGICLAIKQSH